MDEKMERVWIKETEGGIVVIRISKIKIEERGNKREEGISSV